MRVYTELVVALGLFFAVQSAQAVVKRPSIVPRFSGAAVGEWTMDHDAALAQARTEDKNVVVLFNGAWWCPHCQALEETVLTNAAWQAYVEEKGLYLVTMDFPGRADQYWCWLRETNYVQSVGLTLAEGEGEIVRRYGIQTSYAVPNAPVNPFGNYLRVGYPTLIVLRPDGSRLGRFTPLRTTVSIPMVIRNINQILAADVADELDNYYQGATEIMYPDCEDEEHALGDFTLSEDDSDDWYAFDAAADTQWSFSFRETGIVPGSIRAQVFSHPTNVLNLAERTMVPSDLSVLSFIAPHTGRYWLKVSSAESLTNRIGYALSCWYGTSPADVFFSVPQVTVSERAPSVTLTVKIANAAVDSEVKVGYETVAGSATPGKDYVPVLGELSWGPGVKSPKTITIPLLVDEVPVWEGAESFGVRLFMVKNCSIGGNLANCSVLLSESSTRLAGKLGFEGADFATLVEGSNAVFSVVRTDGQDGVVTGKVEYLQAGISRSVAELVWGNHETKAKTFVFSFPAETGYQGDLSSTLRLVPLGGAALASTRKGSVGVVRRDDLVVQTLPEFNADPANKPLGLRAAYGQWFYGYGSDAERGEAWLRSAPVNKGGSALLAASVKGPGALSFSGRLTGSDAVLQMLVGGVVQARLETEGIREGLSLAVPAGAQTVYWSVKRGASDSVVDMYGAVRDLVWTALPQAVEPYPFDKAAVINRGVTLAWQDALAAAPFPAGVGVATRYEVYAGLNMLYLAKLSEQTTARFPREGEGADEAALDALIAKANARPFYWRVDTVLTDTQGHRTVNKGTLWSLTVLPDGSPEFVASAGGYDPATAGGVTLPDMTMGVYSEIGPFEVSTVAGDVVGGIIRNGSLPLGMKPEVRSGALWITGVPQSLGTGMADLHLSIKRTIGVSTVMVAGSSVRVVWKVLPLGLASGQFNGHKMTDSLPGCGNATLAVSALGRITGKLYSGGLVYAITQNAFQGQDDTAFFADTVAKSGTNTLALTVRIAKSGAFGSIADIACGNSVYELWRNNWKEPGMAAVLREYMGYYTAGLPVVESTQGPVSLGVGYLTLVINSDGTVTYSGLLADGKGVSGSSPLLYGPDCCSLENRAFFYVLSTPAGYGNRGLLYGLVYLDTGWASTPQDNVLEPSWLSALKWTNTDPKSVYGYNPTTGETPNGIFGFTNVLDVTGGYYDRQIDLRAFYGGGYFGIQSGFFAPADFDGQDGSSGYKLASVPEPARLPVYASSSSTLAFPKSVIVMDSGLIDYARSTNAWYMAVAYNRATGVFTGSFRNYYQGLDPYGVMRQKPVSVTLRGVFLPLRRADQPYADWMGYYLIPDKCRYQGLTGSPMSYPFNWSFGFRMGEMAIPLD